MPSWPSYTGATRALLRKLTTLLRLLLLALPRLAP
jgi:hypothetical protein